MAAASATTAILVLGDCSTSASIVVTFTFEVVGMAGCTIRIILIKWIADGQANAVAVAGATGQVLPVITRIVTPWIMGEVGWYPAVSGMTCIALYIGRQVSVGFGACPTAGTVASITDIRRTAVMHPTATGEGGGDMTGPAVQIGWQVGRHGIILTSTGCTPIDMTAITTCGRGETAMVKDGWDKAIHGMACPAILLGSDMAIILARREITVMAAVTVVANAGMVKRAGNKAGGQVTIATIPVGGEVVGQFAIRGRTIVTVTAVTVDAGVIIACTGKGRGVMTA